MGRLFLSARRVGIRYNALGIVSGAVFLLLLQTAVNVANKGTSSILPLTAELLAMPTFWFGGPFLTTQLLKLVPQEELLNPYIVSLALTFCAFSLYPAARWIIQLGEDFGKRRG